MKPPRRPILSALAIVASACQGCGPGHDRQAVYTAPRGPAVQVDTKDGVGVKPPTVNSRVPASRPLDPSNGVDVPILEPD